MSIEFFQNLEINRNKIYGVKENGSTEYFQNNSNFVLY